MIDGEKDALEDDIRSGVLNALAEGALRGKGFSLGGFARGVMVAPALRTINVNTKINSSLRDVAGDLVRDLEDCVQKDKARRIGLIP